MSQKYTWKLVVTLLVVGLAIYSLIPLRDTKFEVYLRKEAVSGPEFEALMSKAQQRFDSKESPSFYVAIKRTSLDEKIDISKFFPQIPLENSLTNLRKRNSILLDELLRRSHGKLQFGLDLQGGVSFTLEVDRPNSPAGNADQKKRELDKAMEIIGERINGYGVAEPVIRPIGDNRIEVQIAGLNTKDNPEVVDQLKKPARLEFRLVDMIHHPDPAHPDDVPPGYELLTLEEDRGGKPYSEDLYVKRIPELTGKAVDRAYVSRNQYGAAEVGLKFNSEGGERFAEVTRAIDDAAKAGQPRGRLAIVLDGKLYSAPVVQGAITGGSAQITGDFSDRDAFELSNVLNNPLDVPLKVVEMVEVGPTLAKDAIDSGVRASIIGTALVAAFMITYYTVGGIVAVLTLAVNIAIVLGFMSMIGATLTLPGIAGIVLTIGMAVDANILIFERMREELKLGKTLKSALVGGYEKAFITIVDAHITQVCICAIMIWLGTGSIKGFGVTLAIGVGSTLISVLITSHLVMEVLIEKNFLKKFPMMHVLHIENFDFVKYGKPAFISSWLVVILGIAVVVYKGDKIYGTDFAGGDVANITFAHRLDDNQIRTVAAQEKINDVTPSYVTPIGGGEATLKLETPFEKAGPLLAALQKAYPDAKLESKGVESIGGSVGSEVRWNALKSIAASMVVILLYVAFRFEFGFGIGAVVASVHDILMTIGIFVLFGHQFSAPMVAAILSIAGYSINDTIVVFDRIREELKLNPMMKLRDVINLAVNRVFSRSMMTSLTTFLAALSLFVFGTGVMKDLSFTFLVGIITGTFSSIFVAAPIFFWWHKGDRKHVEHTHELTPKYEWAASSRAAE